VNFFIATSAWWILNSKSCREGFMVPYIMGCKTIPKVIVVWACGERRVLYSQFLFNYRNSPTETQATEKNRRDQKQDEPFGRSTGYHYVKIVKVLSSLTSNFLMCIVALVLNYSAFTGAYSG
jgi:hypothetical protein